MEALDEFVAHWRSIPRTGLVPRLSDYLSLPHPKLQPWTIILDIEPDSFPTRLFATSLVDIVGTDLTNRDHLELFPQSQRADVRKRHELVVTHPCGMYSEAHGQTAKGENYLLVGIALPVMRARGAKSIVRFIQPKTILNFGDKFAKVTVVPPTVRWIDIGAGVPAR